MNRCTKEEAQYNRVSRELTLPPEVRQRMEEMAAQGVSNVEEPSVSQELPTDREELAQLFRRLRGEILEVITGLQQSNRTIAEHPDDSDALFTRGTALALSGRYDEALQDFNRALELRPDDPSTLYNRRIALNNLGRN